MQRDLLYHSCHGKKKPYRFATVYALLAAIPMRYDAVFRSLRVDGRRGWQLSDYAR